MQFDDLMWKSILEDLFADFLRFFFADADRVFDLSQKVAFLDKEMAAIATDEPSPSPKYVDKLAKVFTKDGREEWLLCHTEVQGYRDKDFAKRMLTYWYRINDRYGKRITAIVLFTDRDKNFRPSEYRSSFMGTEITYKYNSYKIMDQDEKELEKSGNPFAFVLLTVL